jgi:FkbM family methyltransferase
MKQSIKCIISSDLESRYYQSIVSSNRHKLNEDDKTEYVSVDIGAHIGLFSICNTIQNNCKVYAIEPFDENYNKLISNIAINNLTDRIIPIQKGLYHSTGSVEFKKDTCLWENDTGLLTELSSDRIFDDIVSSISPELLFETIIGLNNNYYFVKCNCEGGEIYLLDYLSKNPSFTKSIERLYIEFHPNVYYYNKKININLLHKQAIDIIAIRKGLNTFFELTRCDNQEFLNSIKDIEYEYSC